MGLVIETILAAKSNLTGGGFEPLTPGTDDVFTVRDFQQGSKAWLEDIWGLDTASKAQFSIASARMNDGQEGLRIALPDGSAVGPAEEPQVLFPGPSRLPVYRADTLKVQVSGTAADDAVFAYTIRYENLEDSDVHYQSWEQIEAQIEKTFGILVTPTAGTCDYGSPVTLSSSDDRLESDKRYALLGGLTDEPCALIAIQGPGTGRYRIGLPGKVDPTVGADWFVDRSKRYGQPCIPIIKSNDRATTLISAVQAAAGGTPNITLNLAQLRG